MTYLKFVDMNNLKKQNCQISDTLEVGSMDAFEFDFDEQELSIHVFLDDVDGKITEIKNISCSIPSYMYLLLKDEKFFLKKVLTGQKQPNKILEIEGIFTEKKKIL